MLVDYNQNAWGRTLASVYSVRAKPEAAVSAPVSWAEVERGISIEDFQMKKMRKRVEKVGDLYKPLLASRGRTRAGDAGMKLPIPLDYPPMEARTAQEIPRGPQWQYEPKWDGFRCLAFRDKDEIHLISKSGQPLGRYFPEMIEALAAIKAKQFVVDGELIIANQKRLDFDALLQRIHPAASRIKKLSEQTPATLVVFDLLVNERRKKLVELTLKDRRRELERFAKKFLPGKRSADGARIRLSPCTDDFDLAKRWFKRMAGPLDGVIAKRLDRPYAAGSRDAMVKIKNLRTADCVVGGFRYGSKTREVASLLLGLYDAGGAAAPRGFYFRPGGDRQSCPDEKAGGAGSPARLHRQRARRPEPMEQGRAKRRLAPAQGSAGGGSSVRPFHGSSFSTWDKTAAVACGQEGEVVHNGAGEKRIGFAFDIVRLS